MDQTIQEIADTAHMAAAYRAIESARDDALFHDPLAGRLCGDRGRAMIAAMPQRAMLGGWSVVVRTRVIDEFVTAAIAEGVDTVLNLGAGLDARPYRMALPAGLRWIEADQAPVMAYKQACLANERAACELRREALDLNDAQQRQALLSKVLGNAQRALVLTEAVTPYLSESAVANLARELRAFPGAVRWLNDYFSPQAYAYRRLSGMSQAMAHAPFLFEPDDYFGRFADWGWVPKETRYFSLEAQRWGRPAPFPRWVRWMTRASQALASPKRRAAMQRYAGFTLFEPGPASPAR